MATPALIKFEHLNQPLNIIVSHDGYPSNILIMLADFIQRDGFSLEDFKTIYYEGGDEEDTIAEVMIDDNRYTVWSYTITSAGKIETRTASEKGIKTLVDPFDELESTEEGYQEQVKGDIQAGLDKLKRFNYTVSKDSPLINIVSNDYF